jgi:hypothetical protein
MRSIIFWDVMPCCLVEVYLTLPLTRVTESAGFSTSLYNHPLIPHIFRIVNQGPQKHFEAITKNNDHAIGVDRRVQTSGKFQRSKMKLLEAYSRQVGG